MTGNRGSQLATQVLELRRAGMSFSAIASKLGIASRDEAAALYQDALDTDDARFDPVLESLRLDRMLTALWPKAQAGDPAAIEKVLKISERREQLAFAEKYDHPLVDAFETSVKSAKVDAEGVDSALVAAGRTIANRVDQAVATGHGAEVTKALYLVPHLNNILREMLATPAARVEGAKEASGGNSSGGSPKSKLTLLQKDAQRAG